MEFQLTHALLRPWRAGDEASLAENANNHKVWRNLGDLFPNPYSLADAEKYLAHTATQKNEHNYAIEVNGLAAGGISLRLQKGIENRGANIGYWLGEAHWGRGIVTEAVQALTAFGFEQLDLLRVSAKVFEWNPASRRVLEKAGFSLEGRERKAISKDGQIIDQFLYAIVRDD